MRITSGLAPAAARRGPGERWVRGLAVTSLAFLCYPALDAAGGPVVAARVAPAALLTVLVVAVYLWACWHRGSAPRQLSPALAFMVVLGVAVPAAWGVNWLGLLLFGAIGCALALPLLPGLVTTACLAVVTVAEGMAIGARGNVVLSLGLVTVLAGLAAAGFVVLTDTVAALRSARAQIARLAAADERLRLARDLHDAVKQHLFVASMELGAATAVLGTSTAQCRAHLGQAGQAVTTAQAELAGLISQMRPDRPAGADLATALRRHLNTWPARHRIGVELSLSGATSCSPLVDDAFLRAAQEALTNVARHSAASTVRVVLAIGDDPAAAELRISDNGTGMRPGSTGGHGLAIMRERLEAVGGTALIHSSPGNGTQVVLRWPSGTDGGRD